MPLVPGTTPLVLVAPHGGRRDPERRPWASGSLKTNDLYTAELTTELAARTGGAALINAAADRNDVDLNRISEAHERDVDFLQTLERILADTVARHERAVLLTVHGWNVIQPAVDLGLGCAPGPDPFAIGAGAAVSADFAAEAVRALVAACASRGVTVTVGARYPARHRENLLQLFNGRYRDDARPPVRALAALSPHVDAVQLELGIPLRWPGAWRGRLIDACLAALPALLRDPARYSVAFPPAAASGAPDPPAPQRLQFAGTPLCGLVALDPGPGGRLLLFPPGGGLVLFTGERTGPGDPRRVGDLTLRPAGDGLAVRFAGPLLRFPDTTPFLDLEAGLSRGRLIDAQVALDFAPDHAGGEFGRVAGRVVLDGEAFAVSAQAFSDNGTITGPWPRVRAALRLPDGAGLSVTIALADEIASGFVCREGIHLEVVAGRANVVTAEAGLERLGLDLTLAGGERLRLAAQATHALPVVRVRGQTALRVEFAACRLDGAREPSGWCEVGGVQ